MKKITLLFMLLVGLTMSAQNKLNFSEVIQVEGVSKSELHERAFNWFINTFRNANNVIQVNDKENGQITAKALLNYTPSFLVGSGPVKGYISYTVSIYSKDGRYKYEITDFYHDPTGPNKKSVGIITDDEIYPGEEKKQANQKWMNETWSDIKSQIEANNALLILGIKKNMIKVSEYKNEDW